MTDKTICLVMIVKNEALTLPRSLSAVRDHIDYYVIVDTGSTDNTIDVIKSQLNEVEGEIIERPWVNFGANRTEALSLAKDSADYMILCDADEELVFNDFDKSGLVHDSYLIRYNGKLDYAVPYLIKSTIPWVYEGVTHEFLSSSVPTNDSQLDSITINDYGDGGSKADKYKRDVKLLLQGIKDEPTNSRYKFYLANSFKDSNRPKEAIKWYKERIEDGGWIEEVTCSYEYLGICYDRIGSKSDALYTWLKGYNYNPKRAECIYEAIKLMRLDGMHETTWGLVCDAERIRYPVDDKLFIRKDIYDYLLKYEMTLIAYYAHPNWDARDTFTPLLQNNNIDHQNLLANYKFYSKSIAFSETGNTGEINLDELVGTIDGYVNSSPSIMKTMNGYVVNVRRVSYKIGDDGSYHFLNKTKTIDTINTKVMLDHEFKKVGDHHDWYPVDLTEKEINGVEDVRIVIEPDGSTMYTGNTWINKDQIRVVYGDYNVDDENLESSMKKIKSPFNTNFEKNWCPFIHNNRKTFVYSWDPIRIGIIKAGELEFIKEDSAHNLRGFRGSSSGFHYVKDDEIWFLTHVVEYSSPRHYYHAIVILDSESLEFKRVSRLFTFEGEKIEFGLGLIVEDERIIMTYSTWDGSANLKVYDKKHFMYNNFENEEF